MATAKMTVSRVQSAAAGEWQLVLLERVACARAVCPRCRFDQSVRRAADGFYHDVNVGNGVFPHRCEASAIWDRDREELPPDPQA